MLAMLLFGTIGFLDDYRKMALRRSLGLTGKQKLAGQFLIAVGVWVILYFTSVSVGGPPMLRVGELRDSTNLAVKLRDKRDPVSDYLASQLSPEMQQTLKVYGGTSPLPEADQRSSIGRRLGGYS